jgi:hypothetical protein
MEHCVTGKMPEAAASNVIAFVRPQTASAALTMRDRMDVSAWRCVAHDLGYDRLIIHERDSFDPPDLGSFLSIYKRDDRWARWSVARRGARVVAWCGPTGTDVGEFASVSDALRTLLLA